MIAGMTKQTQAVVIGASIAGLLAARALSEAFDRTVVVERDLLPDDASDRRGVPQGKHLHGLLAGGLVALNTLFPGFDADLLAAGALRSDVQSDIYRVHCHGVDARAQPARHTPATAGAGDGRASDGCGRRRQGGSEHFPAGGSTLVARDGRTLRLASR
jgi:hypothetical protein